MGSEPVRRKLTLDLDEKEAIDRLLKFLAISGITGQEKAIGQAVIQSLLAAGVPKKAIRFDRAHEHLPMETQTGNLVVLLPGAYAGPRRLFSAHLDTVPLCFGAQPVRKGNRVFPAGETALGGDDRTGVACLVTLAATLLKRRLPYPPITLLFTVREESGLWGARFVDPGDLGDPAVGFNVDGRSPAELTIGAVGATHWSAEIFGQAAHAGVHPERGVSATAAASLALAELYQNGWFGKVARDSREGTANVGYFGGQDGKSAGEATNVVTDYVLLKGEARSHDRRFAQTITAAYRQAFRQAAQRVRSERGQSARVRFQARREYFPYRLKPNAPVIQLAQKAAALAGLKPTLRVSNGGLDANWLVRHGIPTLSIGAGQNNIHGLEEYVDLGDYLRGCRLALALATLKVEQET